MLTRAGDRTRAAQGATRARALALVHDDHATAARAEHVLADLLPRP